jgi:DNA-directed RNA polymerase specialized sigma24 family protein
MTARDFENLVDLLRQGDSQAVTDLWNDHYASLVRLAAQRLPARLRRTGDEEDVALSAFHSFIAGVRNDRFPDLQGPENLWSLLITLTSRKVNAHVRRQTRQKRGGGMVRGESVFLEPDGSEKSAGIGGVGDERPSPEIQAQLSEATDELLNSLDDDQLRQIAIMRMDGYLVAEIASRLQLSKRAIERRLNLIRKIWSEQAES